MSSVGLVIVINKYKNYFETKQHFLICDTLFNTKEKLLELLTEYFNKINIDYPLKLEDFEYEWFGQQYVKSNAFSYKIFVDGKWDEPWELQDIYDEVLERIVKHEIDNYKPDEENENFSIKDIPELNGYEGTIPEELVDFNKKISSIIEKSKDA